MSENRRKSLQEWLSRSEFDTLVDILKYQAAKSFIAAGYEQLDALDNPDQKASARGIAERTRRIIDLIETLLDVREGRVELIVTK